MLRFTLIIPLIIAEFCEDILHSNFDLICDDESFPLSNGCCPATKSCPSQCEGTFSVANASCTCYNCKRTPKIDLTLPERWAKAHNFFRCQYGFSLLEPSDSLYSFKTSFSSTNSPEEAMEELYKQFLNGTMHPLMFNSTISLDCDNNQCTYSPPPYFHMAKQPIVSESSCCAEIYGSEKVSIAQNTSSNRDVFWIFFDTVTVKGFTFSGYWEYDGFVEWGITIRNGSSISPGIGALPDSICKGLVPFTPGVVFTVTLPCDLQIHMDYIFWLARRDNEDMPWIKFGLSDIRVESNLTNIPSQMPTFEEPSPAPTGSPTVHPLSSPPTATPSSSFPSIPPTHETEPPEFLSLISIWLEANYSSVIESPTLKALFIGEVTEAIREDGPDCACIDVFPDYIRIDIEGPDAQLDDVDDTIKKEGITLPSFGTFTRMIPPQNCLADEDCSETLYCDPFSLRCCEYAFENETCSVYRHCAPQLECLLSTVPPEELKCARDVNQSSQDNGKRISGWIWVWLVGFVLSTCGCFAILFYQTQTKEPEYESLFLQHVEPEEEAEPIFQIFEYDDSPDLPIFQ